MEVTAVLLGVAGMGLFPCSLLLLWWRRKKLRELPQMWVAIDVLWGYMPAEQVKQIRENEQWLYETCSNVHQRLWHG